MAVNAAGYGGSGEEGYGGETSSVRHCEQPVGSECSLDDSGVDEDVGDRIALISGGLWILGLTKLRALFGDGMARTGILG